MLPCDLWRRQNLSRPKVKIRTHLCCNIQRFNMNRIIRVSNQQLPLQRWLRSRLLHRHNDCLLCSRSRSFYLSLLGGKLYPRRLACPGNNSITHNQRKEYSTQLAFLLTLLHYSCQIPVMPVFPSSTNAPTLAFLLCCLDMFLSSLLSSLFLSLPLSLGTEVHCKKIYRWSK